MTETAGTVGGSWRLLGLFLLSPGAGVRTLAVKTPLLIPMLVLCLGMVALNFLSIPFTDQLARTQLPEGLEPEQLEQIERFQQLVLHASVFLTPLTMACRWALIAGLLYLISVLANGRMHYRQSYALVVLASLPLLGETALNLVILFLRGVDSIAEPFDLMPPIGLSLLFSPQSPAWYSILNSVNLFEIWHMILLVLGISALNDFGCIRSGVIVLSVWGFQVGTGVATLVLGGIAG